MSAPSKEEGEAQNMRSTIAFVCFGLIIFIFMMTYISSQAHADQTLWVDTKEKYSFNINVTAPKMFWNCDIAPDGTGGWDNCTAYLRVKNNGNAINSVETAIIWDKPSMVNNTKMYRTNTFNLFTKKTNETWFNNTKGNYSILWNNQTYLNATNFIEYNPASTNIERREEFIVKMTMQRKSWNTVSFNMSVKKGQTTYHTFDPNMSACGNLNAANSVYTMNATVTSTGTCFTVLANNITLDGNGYGLTLFSNATVGYGITSNGYNDLIVKNMIFYDNTTEPSGGSHGIYLLNGNNIYFRNVSVYSMGISTNAVRFDNISNSIFQEMTMLKTEGRTGHGIYVSDSNNNVFHISVINVTGVNDETYPIWLDGVSANNYFERVDAFLYSSTADGLIALNSPTDNFFTNVTYGLQETGHTDANWEFYDAGATMSYRQDETTDIWIKAKSNIKKTIQRAVYNISQNELIWNDSVQISTATLNYTIIGLKPLSPYKVMFFDGTSWTIPYNLTADASGALPSFSQSLSTNTNQRFNISWDVSRVSPVNFTILSPANMSSFNQSTSVSMVFNLTHREFMHSCSLWTNESSWSIKSTKYHPQDNTVYYASAFNNVTGKILNNTLNSTQSRDGIYFTLSEASGSLSMDYIFNFSINFFETNELHINLTGRYEGNPAHVIEMYIYNYTGNSWRFVETIYSTTSDVSYEMNSLIITPDNYRNNISQIRLLHPQNGITTHKLYIDQFYITNYHSSINYTWANVGTFLWTISCNNTVGTVTMGSENRTIIINSTEVPATDAAFAIAFISDYTSWTSATGTTEGLANYIGGWVSFNFTAIPEYMVGASQYGNPAYQQQGTSRPLMIIDPQGNTPVNISIKFMSALPANFKVSANASCEGTYTSCQNEVKEANTNYLQVVGGLSQADGFANVSLYANLTGNAKNSSAFDLMMYGVAA